MPELAPQPCDLLIRNGRTATVTEAKEFAEIIRRRLFETVPVADKIAALADTWHDQMGGRWRKDVFDRSGWANKREFKAKTERSYPFHPALIDLAEKEWSLTTGFQRVRSTIQVFAASVFALQQRILLQQDVQKSTENLTIFSIHIIIAIIATA